MADKPVDEVVQLEAVLDALSGSPTTSDVYEAVLPFSNAAVSAVAAKRALAGGGGGGGGSVLLASDPVHLTSAQILALGTTPVEIVPAPGAGKVLLPFNMIGFYTAVSTPYDSSGSDLSLVWPGQNGSNLFFDQTDLGKSMATASVWIANPGRMNSTGGTDIDLVEVENQPLVLACDNGVAVTGGDGTLDVIVYYIEVTVP